MDRTPLNALLNTQYTKKDSGTAKIEQPYVYNLLLIENPEVAGALRDERPALLQQLRSPLHLARVPGAEDAVEALILEEEDHVEAVPEIRDDANPVKSRARRNSEILAEMRRTGKARPLSAPPRSSTFQVKMGIPAAFPVWKNRSVTPTGGGYGKMRIRSARGART